jgi:stage II sporulation protein D
MRRLLLLALALAGTLLTAAPAGAATRFFIKGAGFGHGVGMSQYGAYGFAQHGKDYRFILDHYYQGTALGSTGERTVRVLLQSGPRAVSFTGATQAGSRALRSDRTYSVTRVDAGTVALRSPSGRRLANFTAPLRVAGGAAVLLRGTAGNGIRDGRYRGELEIRPGLFGGVNAINAVSLEDYVQGVVPAEMPAGWSPEALKAQAVTARTYALATSVRGTGFDQYPDTRSQVYGGVAREAPSSSAAVAATRGQIVTYGGRPVATYFFSTSGGRTEDVEFSFLNAQADPWLVSVDDPFDDISPRHRWGPYKLTLAQAQRKLGNLVKGRFRGIDVVQRGRSPRVVAADVIGTGGRTRVTGPTLRARLGLFDTWAYFSTISARHSPAPAPAPPSEAGGGASSDPSGGTAFSSAVRARLARTIGGRIDPAVPGAPLPVEQLRRGHWVRVGSTRVRAGGRWSVALAHAGRYRVRYHGLAGPGVTVR